MTQPCPPDSARVWRGFRADKYHSDYSAFVKILNSDFIPKTVEMMQPLGLCAYLPTILPEDKSSFLPDEIALVFYQSQAVYRVAKETSHGKKYSTMHREVFNFDQSGNQPVSGSDFPRPLLDMISPDQPYHLFDESVDWQEGDTLVSVGQRLEGVFSEDVRNELSATMSSLRKGSPQGLDGLIFVALDDYVLMWSHWRATGATCLLNDMNQTLCTVLCSRAIPTTFPQPATYAKPGQTINMQFKRHCEKGAAG